MTKRLATNGALAALACSLAGCAIPFPVPAPPITPDLASQRLAASSPLADAFCVNDVKPSHLVSFGYAVRVPAEAMAQALVGGLASAGALATPGQCRYAIAAQVTGLRNRFVNLPFAPLPITSVVTYTMTPQSPSGPPVQRTITDHFSQAYVFTIPLDLGSEETVHRAIRNAIRDNLHEYLLSLINSPSPPPVT